MLRLFLYSPLFVMFVRRLPSSRRVLSALRPARRKPRNLIRAARRSGAVPPFWRVVDGRITGPDGEPARGRMPDVTPPPHLSAWWKLALDAKGLPWMADGHGANARLFVPALFERMARAELAAVTAESLRGQPAPLPLKRNLHWTLIVLLIFLLWQGFISGWRLLPDSADQGFAALQSRAELWRNMGALDVARVIRNHEYWRCITALTLHADAQHFFGNLLFGGLLLGVAARRMGLGTALLLAVLAGTLGNAANTLYRPLHHVSLGFSTAVFSLAGIIGADSALREGRAPDARRKVLLPLGAALALLAMLGTEGERTDYAAHIFGLAAGIGLGLIAGYVLRERGVPRPALQILLGLIALLLPLLAWIAAIRA